MDFINQWPAGPPPVMFELDQLISVVAGPTDFLCVSQRSDNLI